MPIGMGPAPRMKRRWKLRAIDMSYTSSWGWKCRPRTSPPRVVPLVMKTRSSGRGASQRSSIALKASMGTAGMSVQRCTLRNVAPRRWQKVR